MTKKRKVPDSWLEDCPKAIYFPAFIGKKIWRQFARMAGNRIITLTDVYEVNTPEDVLTCLFVNNLLLLIDGWTVLSDDLLELCMQYGNVWCTPQGVPRSFQLFGEKRTTRWIIDCPATWDMPATDETLQLLTHLAGHCQAGTPTSPGSLGMTLLRQSWRVLYKEDWYKHRHRRPTAGVCAWLQETCTGARSDVLVEPTETFKSVIALDQKNSYGSAFAGKLPTGKHEEFYGEPEPERYAAYYASVTITLQDSPAYGLFQLKCDDGTITPTSPGVYHLAATHLEIAFWRSQGLQVEIVEGTGWFTTTTDQALFVQTMAELRDTAPTDEIASLVKQALVAGIGRLNMQPLRWKLTEKPTETAFLGSDGIPYHWYVEEYPDDRPQTMPHWYVFTVAAIRVALMKEAVYWFDQEMLLATNTDCVYLDGSANVSAYPPSSYKKHLPNGSWTKETLTRVSFPANRHLVSDQKIRRPGIERSSRKRNQRPQKARQRSSRKRNQRPQKARQRGP